MRRLELQQYHLAVAFDMRQRLSAHLRHQLVGLAPHAGDACDRQARGEDPAQPGAHQQIAAFDIGIDRQIGQQQFAGIA